MRRSAPGNILLLIAATCLVVGFAGCGDSHEAVRPQSSHHTTVFNPPDDSFARGVGIAAGPVTAEQAKSIAAAAAGGVALSVEQEDEDGTQVFGVLVKAGETQKDVKVRISDGAVTRIESDGPEDGGGDEGGGDGEGGNGGH
jgi:hypothetical protein